MKDFIEIVKYNYWLFIIVFIVILLSIFFPLIEDKDWDVKICNKQKVYTSWYLWVRSSHYQIVCSKVWNLYDGSWVQILINK